MSVLDAINKAASAPRQGTWWIDEVRKMGYDYPHKTVMPLSELAEMTVSSNMGTYDSPSITVGVEVSKEYGFANLVVLVPDMEILINAGLEGEELSHYLQEINGNMYECMCVADGEV